MNRRISTNENHPTQPLLNNNFNNLAHQNGMGSSSATADQSVVNMVSCNACGHLVPEWNLAIHQVRACPGNAPRVALRTDDEEEEHRHHPVEQQDDVDHDNDFMDVFDEPNDHRDPTTSATPTLWAHGNDVIDLTSAQEEEAEVQEQWTCHQCTLFNDVSDLHCAACGVQRRLPPAQTSRRTHNLLDDDDNDNCRNPDPIRRERLLPDTQWFSDAPLPFTESPSASSSASSTGVILGGGALVGGMLGAAGAYLRGRPMSSAMLEGAVTGAMGAAVAQQAWQQTTTPPRLRRASNAVLPGGATNVNNTHNYGNGIAAARSSATLGLPSYPSIGSDATNNSYSNTNNNSQIGTARPRGSMRVVSHVSPDGSTRMTIVQHGGRNSVRTRSNNNDRNDNNHDSDADALLAAVQQFLAFSPLLLGPDGRQPPFMHPHHNIDGMSYDQLLEAFGDGTEGRRGASEATIHSLPTQVVMQDPNVSMSSNPEIRTCTICLEHYQKGQTRKCLPCLHGFHEDCIDTWLRSNASCPICKHHLS
jgi:hypothetical protein